MVNDSADDTSSGGHSMSASRCTPATGKTRLPTVDTLMLVGTARRLAHTERGGGSGGALIFYAN